MRWRSFLSAALLLGAMSLQGLAPAAEREIVYITAKLDLPFWGTIGKGVGSAAATGGYAFHTMDSQLSAAIQLQNARDAIARGVAGIVLSPVDSQSAPQVLDLARKANVPVVIADIGTNGGQYVSYVKSDNYRGAYEVGTAVAAALKEKGWHGQPFAMVTISLARKNGQDRTNGFRDAMQDAGITHEGGLRQMRNYSAEETSGYVKSILAETPNVRSIFIETDQPTMGALQTIRAAHKQGELVIGSFDAMPEVSELLKAGPLVAVGMQQPYLMGVKSGEALVSSLQGVAPAKQILVPILVATSKNIDRLMPIANRTVFGLDSK